MPAIKLFPKQTITVRIEGLGDWDGTSQPPFGRYYINNIFQACKDYQPRYIQVTSLTIYTPRSLTGGAVFHTGSTQLFPVLTDLTVAWNGNFIGYQSSASVSDTADVVGTAPLVLTQAGRTKATCYWAKRDQGIVWDYQGIAAAPQDRQVNPIIAGAGLENNAPVVLGADTYMDARITRWGYFGPPSKSVKLSILELMDQTSMADER